MSSASPPRTADAERPRGRWRRRRRPGRRRGDPAALRGIYDELGRVAGQPVLGHVADPRPRRRPRGSIPASSPAGDRRRERQLSVDLPAETHRAAADHGPRLWALAHRRRVPRSSPVRRACGRWSAVGRPRRRRLRRRSRRGPTAPAGSRRRPDRSRARAAAPTSALERWGKRRSLNRRLERAGSPSAPGEFLVLVGASAGAVPPRLAPRWPAPRACWLRSRRSSAAGVLPRPSAPTDAGPAFSDQLGDTLQLLAGSLRAGYGLLQAIDAVPQEAQEPTRQEFRRLVVETRLGRDLSDALHSMAERVGRRGLRLGRAGDRDPPRGRRRPRRGARHRRRHHPGAQPAAPPGQGAQRRGPAVGLHPHGAARRCWSWRSDASTPYLSELGHGTRARCWRSSVRLARVRWRSGSAACAGSSTDDDPWESKREPEPAARCRRRELGDHPALVGPVRSAHRRADIGAPMAWLAGCRLGPVTDLRAATLAHAGQRPRRRPGVAVDRRAGAPAHTGWACSRSSSAASCWPGPCSGRSNGSWWSSSCSAALIGVVLALRFAVEPSFCGLACSSPLGVGGRVPPPRPAAVERGDEAPEADPPASSPTRSTR